MKKLLIALMLPFSAFAGTATLNWTAPTTNTDGSPITGALTYRVYGALQGSTKALIGTGISPYVHTQVPTGTFCYAVTAVVAGIESAQTPEVCRVIPAPTPNPPTITAIAVVAGVVDNPVFKILADGSRSSAVAGFVSVGTACTGPVVFTYRGKSFRRVDPASVKWWNTTRTTEVAAACA